MDERGKEVGGRGKEVGGRGKEVDGRGKEVGGRGKEVDGRGKEVGGEGRKWVEREGSEWEIGGSNSLVMQRPMAHAFFLHGSSSASMSPETGNII